MNPLRSNRLPVADFHLDPPVAENGAAAKVGLEAALVDDLHRVLSSLNRSIYAPPMRPVEEADARRPEGRDPRPARPVAVNDDDRVSEVTAGDRSIPPWMQGRRRSHRIRRLKVSIAAAIVVSGVFGIWPASRHESTEVSVPWRASMEADRLPSSTPAAEPETASPLTETPPALASISSAGAEAGASTSEKAGVPAETAPPLSEKPAKELGSISLSIDARPDPAPGEPAEPGIELAAIATAAGLRPAAEPFLEEPKVELSDPVPEPDRSSPELTSLSLRPAQKVRQEPVETSAVPSERDEPGAPVRESMKVRNAVNMRAEPDNAARVVGVIPSGRRVDVIECKLWCRVAFEGKRGWIFKSFLSGFDAPRAWAQRTARPVAPLLPLDADLKPPPCDQGWSATALSLLKQGFGGGSSHGDCRTGR